MTWWVGALSIIGSISGLSAIGAIIWWAARINTKVEKLWELYPKLISTNDKVDILWRRIVDYSVEHGLVSKGSLKLTDEGMAILKKGLASKIDSVMQQLDEKHNPDLAPSVISAVYDDLVEIAKEHGKPVEVLFGLIEAYVRRG